MMATATMATMRRASVTGVTYLIPAMILVFGWLSPRFLSAGNISNIALQSSVLLVIALPMTLVIMCEGIDLSQGPMIGLCGVITAMIISAGGSPSIGILAAIGLGLAVGLFNGALVALLRLPPFVVTLGAYGMAWGLALAITDGETIVGLGSSLTVFDTGRAIGVPVAVWIAATAYALCHLLLYHTKFGTYVFAIGGSHDALKLAGRSANAYHIAVYAFGGAMVGVASVLLTARMNSGHPTAAIGLEFDAIAAVIVGGTSFEKGNGWLFGTLLGVIAIGLLRNGLNLIAVPSALQVVCVGLLVIISLIVERLRSAP